MFHRYLTIFFLALAFVPSFVLADTTGGAGGCDGYDASDKFGVKCAESSGLATGDARVLVGKVINAALSVLGVILVAIIIYAGFKILFSGGNTEKIGEARKMLFAAVLGLAIILLAYTIANFVIDTLTKATDLTDSSSP